MNPPNLQTVRAGQLAVSYREVGPSTGAPVILLHGFPYDVHAFDEVAPRLAAAGRRCLIPYLRGFGPTFFLDSLTPKSGQQGALGHDLLSFMDALQISSAVLAGFDWGARAACIVAALWPERVAGLVACGGTGYNIQNISQGERPAAPEKEHRLWYQHYFRTERGRAGLAQDRAGLCRLLWRHFSPTWAFDDATYRQTAAAFDNPDFLEIVIHSYRHRFGGVPGDPALDGIEARLAAQPSIAVPAILLQGEADGVEPPLPIDADAPHFTGPYARRLVPGVGHNFPQESPEIFAAAAASVAR